MSINDMMNWVTHLNPQSYRLAETKALVTVCQEYRHKCPCLFRHKLSACYWGAAVLLFILLPHLSHKVNCWDDLYLSKHLRDITSLATPSVWRAQTQTEYVCVCLEKWHRPNLSSVMEPWNSPRGGITLCDVSASQSIKHSCIFLQLLGFCVLLFCCLYRRLHKAIIEERINNMVPNTFACQRNKLN